MEQITVSGHTLDLTRLRRRRPDLNVTVLKYEWHGTSIYNGFFRTERHWCSDPRKFPLSYVGQIWIIPDGDQWLANFGHSCDWGGTPYESFEEAPYLVFSKKLEGSLDEAKREAELIYNMRLVPLMLGRDSAAEENLRAWIRENAIDPYVVTD